MNIWVLLEQVEFEAAGRCVGVFSTENLAQDAKKDMQLRDRKDIYIYTIERMKLDKVEYK